MEPRELVAAVCPRIKDLGWAFYFTPETAGVGRELGLDVFRFYFLGRGGVLGDANPEVVLSAFGYFSPSLVENMWSSAKSVCPPRDAARAYLNCSADLGRTKLSGIADLGRFCEAAAAVNEAADPFGLTLYAGIRAMPLAEDTPGRAMQLVTVLREFRGSAHLIAVRAQGLDGRTAHYITRPADMALFGWGDDDVPEVTQEQRDAMRRAEALTDDLVLPAYAVLDEDERRSLVDGIDAIGKALAG